MSKKPLTDKPSIFTDREWEVIKCIAEGMDNKEIMETLFISRTTINMTVSKIYSKLGIRSREKLVAMYYKGELHNLDEEN